MNSAVILAFSIALIANLGGAAGTCVQVNNTEMLEYACMGGHPADLDVIPKRTEKIRIRNMIIPIITSDTFSRFDSNLWVLSCSFCGIMNIKDNAFRKLVNLQQLNLDSNHITTVRGSWFEGLDLLTYLDLSYNDISMIEDDVYKNLPSLVDLRISGNNLECLNLEAMAQLKELKRIFLSENKELKCPNAISKFLESHGVTFEKDSEWSKMPYDLVRPEMPSMERPTSPRYETPQITTVRTPIEAMTHKSHYEPHHETLHRESEQERRVHYPTPETTTYISPMPYPTPERTTAYTPPMHYPTPERTTPYTPPMHYPTPERTTAYTSPMHYPTPERTTAYTPPMHYPTPERTTAYNPPIHYPTPERTTVYTHAINYHTPETITYTPSNTHPTPEITPYNPPMHYPTVDIPVYVPPMHYPTPTPTSHEKVDDGSETRPSIPAMPYPTPETTPYRPPTHHPNTDKTHVLLPESETTSRTSETNPMRPVSPLMNERYDESDQDENTTYDYYDLYDPTPLQIPNSTQDSNKESTALSDKSPTSTDRMPVYYYPSQESSENPSSQLFNSDSQTTHDRTNSYPESETSPQLLNIHDMSSSVDAIIDSPRPYNIDSVTEIEHPYDTSRENEFHRHPHLPGEITWPSMLAPSPADRSETPSFTEPNVARSTALPKIIWSAETDEYMEVVDREKRPHDNIVTTESSGSETTHVIMPYVPALPPDMIQPASPDDFFQAPYEEATFTIRPPTSLQNYRQRGTTTVPVLPMETVVTTTDKPLPDCKAGATSHMRSLELTVISIMVAALGNVMARY